uniref:Uncharacterized protein n=1 Tax=Anopheles christyi TaxID=43041 RepID=A0A182JNJ5_9DIPT
MQQFIDDTGQVKQYLLELEDEMRAIGKEQNGLVQDLAKRLKHFQRKTASEKHIELGDDLANGYVAWVLSSHAEIQCTAAYVPHAVSERLNESQLYQKYRLMDPLQSCIVDTSPSQPEQGPKGQDTLRLRKRPVLQTSLLKPKEERDILHNTALKEKPSLTTPSPSTLSTPPPPLLPAAGRTGNRRKTPPEQPLVPMKMLRSRSNTPVVVTVMKQEPVKVKQEPLEPEAEAAGAIDSEDRSTPPIVIRETAAVKRGRSNLLQALNKVKTAQKPVAKLLPQPTTSPPASATKSGRNCRAGSVSASSDSSNSRASTPGTGNSGAQPKQATSDDSSSADRLLLLPPEEPAPSLPTNIDELEQYSFLKMFALHTIEDSNMLKGRKNERKRRSCCSTERKEYHYGRFDYYEQQFYIVQKRRYNVNKRLLYTSTSAEKLIKTRKPWTSSVAIPPSPPSLPVQETPVEMKPAPLPSISNERKEESLVLEPDHKLCLVCNKIGKY